MGAVCRCRDVSETGELYGKIRGLGWIPSAMEEARVVVGGENGEVLGMYRRRMSWERCAYVGGCRQVGQDKQKIHRGGGGAVVADTPLAAARDRLGVCRDSLQC